MSVEETSLAALKPKHHKGIVFHSDRGVQYASKIYKRGSYKIITRSMRKERQCNS
jgi:transposase InsO family protein